MPRTILISMLDGLLACSGLLAFIWLAYSRFVWKWPLTLGALWMLFSFVRLSLNSVLQRRASGATPEGRAQLELRKPSPVVTLCFVGILCVVGIIIRYSR